MEIINSVISFNENQPTIFQDIIYIVTKLKIRFLKPNVLLPMGKFNASVKHIEFLMETVSKDKHLLQKSYLKSY